MAMILLDRGDPPDAREAAEPPRSRDCAVDTRRVRGVPSGPVLRVTDARWLLADLEASS